MRWTWIDQIIELAPNERMVAIKNVSLAEDYLVDHFPAADGLEAMPILPASLIIEGMAQTAGILVGLAHEFREKVILAKILVAGIDAEVVPGQTVRYEAKLERIDAAGASTAGTVSRAWSASDTWEDIGRVDLMFSHMDASNSSPGMPRHNFVFGDNLKLLLNRAGLSKK